MSEYYSHLKDLVEENEELRDAADKGDRGAYHTPRADFVSEELYMRGAGAIENKQWYPDRKQTAREIGAMASHLYRDHAIEAYAAEDSGKKAKAALNMATARAEQDERHKAENGGRPDEFVTGLKAEALEDLSNRIVRKAKNDRALDQSVEEGRKHYEENREAYQTRAFHEAAMDGIDINLPPPAETGQ